MIQKLNIHFVDNSEPPKKSYKMQGFYRIIFVLAVSRRIRPLDESSRKVFYSTW